MITWELGSLHGFSVVQNITPGFEKSDSLEVKTEKHLQVSFDFPSEVVQNGVIQLVLHLQNQSDLELSAEVFPKLTDDFMWVGKSRVICSLPPQVRTVYP